MLPPSISEVRTTIRDMEEDLEDIIPLSQRTRVARVATEEHKKSQIPPSCTTQENLVQVEELVEGEAYVKLVVEVPGNEKFRIEQFDFMLVGTTLE